MLQRFIRRLPRFRSSCSWLIVVGLLVAACSRAPESKETKSSQDPAPAAQAPGDRFAEKDKEDAPSAAADADARSGPRSAIAEEGRAKQISALRQPRDSKRKGSGGLPSPAKESKSTAPSATGKKRARDTTLKFSSLNGSAQRQAPDDSGMLLLGATRQRAGDRQQRQQLALAFQPTVEVAAESNSRFWAPGSGATYSHIVGRVGQGLWPRPQQVRTEELLQSFVYDYPGGTADFQVSLDGGRSLSREGFSVLRIGLKARPYGEVSPRHRVVTMVLELSDSEVVRATMQVVLRHAQRLLTGGDRINLIVYGTSARYLLRAGAKQQLPRAQKKLAALPSEAATAVVDAARLAVQQQATGTQAGGEAIRRLLWFTGRDSWWSRGRFQAVADVLRLPCERGLLFTTVAIGEEHPRRSMMDRLATALGSAHVRIGKREQAPHVLREQLGKGGLAFADRLRLELTFDPNVVRRYRLLGYERRGDDSDEHSGRATPFAYGQELTALYEVQLTDVPQPAKVGDLRVHYRNVRTMASHSQTLPLRVHLEKRFDEMEPATRLAVLLAQLAEDLRHSPWLGPLDHAEWLRLLAALPPSWTRRTAIQHLRRQVRSLAQIRTNSRLRRGRYDVQALAGLVGQVR